MPSSTDFTHIAPSVVEGFLVQAESTVRIGTARYTGSLEVASSTYTATYDFASQGLQSGKAVNFGILEGVSIELTAEFEDIEATNILSTGIKVLTDEGATVGMTLKSFDPLIIEFLIQNGIVFTINAIEKFITFGGTCTTKSRPLELSTVNLACGTPTSQGVANGITGILFTIYDGQFTSGLNWGDLQAQSENSLEATYEAITWTDKALGNRLGNILFY